MRRSLRFSLILLLCCALLSGCSTTGWSVPVATDVPGVSVPELSVSGSGAVAVKSGSVLYFRYLDEPYLAPETRTVTQAAGQSYEYALLSALLAGPGTHSASLNGVFPDGVRLLSTVKQGRTLFVTLSAEIMEPYADEPDNWQAEDEWRREVPLRRQLCMQAIVATVTENCDIDRVQVLVQQDMATGSLRLRQNYFMDDSEDDVLVGPMTREEGLLLTQSVTAEVILSCWQQRDWARLYRYVASTDPESGIDRSDYDAFVQEMEALPAISSYTLEGSSVTADGSHATLTVSCTLLSGLQATETGACVLHLCREDGMWRITQEDLTSWLEEVLG